MPGDLEDLLGGLPPSKPSNSSKPRYCKLNVWLTRCKFVWSILYSKLLLTCIPDLSTDCQSENLYKIHKDRDSWHLTLTLIYVQGVWRQAATSVIISAISDKLQECLGSTSAKVYISLRIFSSQGWNRILVSLFSWPGQLLSLNPCRRPKIRRAQGLGRGI